MYETRTMNLYEKLKTTFLSKKSMFEFVLYFKYLIIYLYYVVQGHREQSGGEVAISCGTGAGGFGGLRADITNQLIFHARPCTR